MANNNTKNVSEQIIASILFIFFIDIACNWSHPIKENILHTIHFLGIIFSITLLGCIILLIRNLRRHRYTRIKRILFLFAPNLTLLRIGSIIAIVFMIITTILWKNDIETNFILSLRIAGAIWVTSIFSEIIITNRRKKRYEEIIKQRRKEPQEAEKQVESTI